MYILQCIESKYTTYRAASLSSQNYNKFEDTIEKKPLPHWPLIQFEIVTYQISQSVFIPLTDTKIK